MSDETPFAVALSLLRGGATGEQIEAALKARGLDAVEVELVMTAARNSSQTSAPPLDAAWSTSPPEPAPVVAVPDVPVGSCARCGTFITTGNQVLVLSVGYCAACAERPEVNSVRQWRDARWGRRDAWAWVMGAFALLEFVSAVRLTTAGAPERVLMLLCACAVHSLFFAGVRVARALLVLMCILVCAVSLVDRGVAALGTVVLLGLLTWSVLSNVRTMLFFKLEPTEAELKAAYLSSASNPPASWGLVLGLAALASSGLWGLGRQWTFVTGALGAAGASLSLLGLWRVDLKAVPPIGMRARALGGVALSALSILAAVVRK